MALDKTWLFEQLPTYFWENDTYKDVDGKGFLQRYLNTLGEPIEDVLVFITEFVTIFDPTQTPASILQHMAYTLGNPADPLETTESFRKIIQYALSIYKIKGTKKSYELFFSAIGYQVSLVEHFKNRQKYDSSYSYDQTVDAFVYDSGLINCSEYSLFLKPVGSGSVVTEFNLLDADLQARILSILKMLEPHNVHLRVLSSGLELVDPVYRPGTESVDIVVTPMPF